MCVDCYEKDKELSKIFVFEVITQETYLCTVGQNKNKTPLFISIQIIVQK